jgi:hypothetical protein
MSDRRLGRPTTVWYRDLDAERGQHKEANKEAMAWQDMGDIPGGKKNRPRDVRRMGFAGLVSDTEYDHAHPQENVDHVDNHLRHFIQEHAPHMSVWHQHGTLGPVDISKGVYATQSHLSPFHVERYRQNRDDPAWAVHPTHGDEQYDDNTNEYQAHPMFVTHHGRLHAADGHHRIATSLQEGDEKVNGWHYDLDAKPVVTNKNGEGCRECQFQHRTTLSEQAHDGPQSHTGRRTASVGIPVPPEHSGLVESIHRALTDDLLKPEYRSREDRHPTSGHCYAASEAAYHLLGGKDAGWTPMNIRHEGDSHWFLRDDQGHTLDPTHEQFKTPVPYNEARGKGFLTREPSRRAQTIIDRVQNRD